MLRLCVRCGEEVPPGASCSRCGAAEPRWERTQAAWAGLMVSGLFCLVAVAALGASWIGHGDAVQAIAAIVVGLVGVPAGVALLVAGVRSFGERAWQHPAVDGRGAWALTRWGKIVSAGGGGRLTSDPLAVPANDLDAVEAFTHYGALRRALPAAYGLGKSPPRVDVAMTATVLALAGRDRLALRRMREVTWSRAGADFERAEATIGVEVRRLDGRAPAGADGGVEALLLDAMAAPETQIAPATASAPYRAPGAVIEADREADWVRLRDVIARLTGGDVTYRRGLRARLAAVAISEQARRTPEAVGAEFAAVVDAAGDRALGGAIVREIEQGFSTRAPA